MGQGRCRRSSTGAICRVWPSTTSTPGTTSYASLFRTALHPLSSHSFVCSLLPRWATASRHATSSACIQPTRWYCYLLYSSIGHGQRHVVKRRGVFWNRNLFVRETADCELALSHHFRPAC